MSTEPTLSPRDQELRRMLVATASAEPSQPRRRSTVIASIAAFTLAGALTGGAVSAAALNANSQATSSTPTSIPISRMMQSLVHDDDKIYGTPFVLSGQGDTTIQLGSAPNGAEQIAVVFQCVDTETVEALVDGKLQAEFGCAEDNDASGSYFGLSKKNEHTLTLKTQRSQRFVVWISWATRATPPEPGADQVAALSDGVVTDVEYRDGFARYNTCMSDAGYPLVRVDDTGTIISYSNTSDAVTSGVESRCYSVEFKDLDITWQIQNEQVSSSTPETNSEGTN